MQISEDWRPAALTGNRRQGYVRLESGSNDLLQIRWEHAKHGPSDLRARAERYLEGLQRMGRKRKQKLTHATSESNRWVDFKWNADSKGVGRLLHDSTTHRIFILERSGSKSDSIVTEAHRIFDSFQTSEERVPWSVLDFQVNLPGDLELEKFKFLTGRLTLQFKAKGIDLTAERWSLADSILAKHRITDWAKGLIGDGEMRMETPYLHLSIPRKLTRNTQIDAYVRHDPEANRLLVLKATHRNRPPDPTWLL